MCHYLQVQRLVNRRLDPGVNFARLHLVKDSLALMLESMGLLDDALREYHEVSTFDLWSVSASL